MRLATVDVGTNSAKLLICEWTTECELIPRAHAYRMIRLGEGVDASGVLSKGAIQRLINTLIEFQGIADPWAVEDMVVVGTSASRDSGSEVIEIVRKNTGINYHIITGDQEADMSFEGALDGLPDLNGGIISCDIGGGSTELVEGTSDGCISNRVSIDIGSVRITERYFSSLPPSQSEIASATAYIRSSLKNLPFSQLGREIHLLGASDAQRLLLDLQYQLTQNHRLQYFERFHKNWRSLEQKESHHHVLSRAQLSCWSDCLLKMTYDDILGLDTSKLYGRADVFPAAVLIFLEVMKRLEKESILISPWGLNHGIALRIFKHGRI